MTLRVLSQEDFAELLAASGVMLMRRTPEGHYAAVIRIHGGRYLVTSHVHEVGYEEYWVYTSFVDSAKALTLWDFKDDPPGPWIKNWEGKHNPKLFIILGVNSTGGEYARRNLVKEEDTWK